MNPYPFHYLQQLGMRVAWQKLSWRLQLWARQWQAPKAHLNGDIPPEPFPIRPYLLQPNEVNQVATWAKKHRPKAVTHTIAVADDVVAGKVYLLRLGLCDVPSTKPEWDKVTAEGRARLLARHDFLLFLGLAFAYTHDVKYQKALWRYITSWLQERGEQREAKSIDVAVRMMNWAWLRQIPNLLPSDAGMWEQWVKAVRQDVHLIYQKLSPGGNHLIVDAAGLWAAGVMESDLPEASQWRADAAHILAKSAQQQFSKEGMHLERTTSYHLLVMRFLLEFVMSHTTQTYPEREGVKQILEKAAYTTLQLQQPDGSFSLFSDGYTFNSEDNEHLRNLAVLWLDHYLFAGNLPALPSDHPSLDWVAWFFVPQTPPPPMPSTPNLPTGCYMMSEAGYAVLRTQSGHMAIMDAGDFGLYGFPHHGHADALHFTLSLQGIPLLIDVGGYDYYPNQWRHWARSTTAHNTMVVDGQSQTEIAGTSTVGYMAEACFLQSGDNEWGCYAIAQVKHHRAHPAKPLHTRALAVLEAGVCLVLDQVTAQGGALCELFWHFHPAVIVEPIEDGWQLMAQGTTWSMRCVAEVTGEWTQAHGQEEPTPQGWYVPDAIIKEATTTLCWRGKLPASGTMRIGTAFIPASEEQPSLLLSKQGLQCQLAGQTISVDFKQGATALQKSETGSVRE